MHTKFQSVNTKGRNNSEDLGVDNIRMDLREIGWEGADWIHLAREGASSWLL
jgi:hypothetical protein